VFFISLFVAFGIYLGRYLRFNSWDIFTKPLSTVQRSMEIFSNSQQHPTFLAVIIFFTLFIFISAYSFQKIRS